MSVTEVHDSPDQSRYEITADGALAGFAEYRLRGKRITFFHTQIDDAYGGRGLGGTLVKHALDDARARGLTAVPLCPFFKAWIAKHPEYADPAEAVGEHP